jgi:hypothetical protein
MRSEEAWYHLKAKRLTARYDRQATKIRRYEKWTRQRTIFNLSRVCLLSVSVLGELYR